MAASYRRTPLMSSLISRLISSVTERWAQVWSVIGSIRCLCAVSTVHRAVGAADSPAMAERGFGHSTKPISFNRDGSRITMGRSLMSVEWKPGDIAGNGVVTSRQMPFFGQVESPVLVPYYVIERCSFSGALNECVRLDGRPDNEICRDMHISPGYMSKFLRSVGEAWFKRMALFMRTTRCLAPLQKLAHELGCDVVPRDSRAAEVAALKSRLQELERAVA